MIITWSSIWVLRLGVIMTSSKKRILYQCNLNGMSIVVYGDQDFLAFCVPISVEMHKKNLILGGK